MNKYLEQEKARTRKLLYSVGIAAALFVAGAVGFPFLQLAYKKHEAKDVLNQTERSISLLERTVNVATSNFKDNEFLMTGNEEKYPYMEEIKDSTDKLALLK